MQPTKVAVGLSAAPAVGVGGLTGGARCRRRTDAEVVLQPAALGHDHRHLAHEALPVEARLRGRDDRGEPLILDRGEVRERAERGGLCLERVGLLLRLGGLRLVLVDLVRGQHVGDCHHEDDGQHADDGVGGAGGLAGRLRAALLRRDEVDGPHALVPIARPAATVKRCGSSPASADASSAPSGAATEVGRPRWTPRLSASSVVTGAGTRQHDLADGLRLRLGHVVVDREPDLVGEPRAGVLVLPDRGQRPGEEAGGADGDRQVADAAEVAEDARGVLGAGRRRPRPGCGPGRTRRGRRPRA